MYPIVHSDPALGSPLTAWVMYSHMGFEGGRAHVASIALVSFFETLLMAWSIYTFDRHEATRDNRGYAATLYSVPSLGVTKMVGII